MTSIILGAGIAGLGAAYALRKADIQCIILEKDTTYGGLCGNFDVNGFRFDRFAHFSFAKSDVVNEIFHAGSPQVYRHTPLAYNLYHGTWIKHPAQNNLYPLPPEIKEKIIEDFRSRPNINDVVINNYEDWLRAQYGNYFAEHFPMVYTRKYWMTEASGLETRWVGQRLYQPSIDEVIQGAQSPETPVTYYAKEMRYPKYGGFKQYLKHLAEGADIRYEEKAVHIDCENRRVTTAQGHIYEYTRLISSLPLPEIVKMIDNVPTEVQEATAKLRCTHGYQVSVTLRTKDIPPYLWFYIYDEDILPSRVYAPSLKSPDNVPQGCSLLQMEIYCDKDAYTREELIEKSVGKLVEQGHINADDIIDIDVRYEPYANVIFDHNIYKCREVVRDFLKEIGITTIGRFGQWDYLWTDQALESGLKIITNY